MESATTNTFWPSRSSASLEIYLLGCVDFDSALFLQQRLVYEISGRSDTQGSLILCEHPPIVTVGREGSRVHVLADSSELVSRQIDVRWSNRGGGCLMHAPGQLAVYPILPLDRLELGLSEYRQLLEESAIEVCNQFQVRAHRDHDRPGVWSRWGQVAHLGIAVRSWVAYHGLFLNVSPAADLMRLVQSNGDDDRVTSLAAHSYRPNSMGRVREGMIQQLAARLGYEQYHIYTGHPLLKRTRRRVYVGA